MLFQDSLYLLSPLIEDERAKVLGTLSNLEKGVEGWIYVVSKGMTKGWERGQNFIGDE